MKKVTSADSIITINHYRNLLRAEGIASEIRNEHLGSILGEMPFTEIWPELWVVNDLDYDRARQLVDAAVADEAPGDDWHCRRCGADNERQFGSCWKCGAAADQA